MRKWWESRTLRRAEARVTAEAKLKERQKVDPDRQPGEPMAMVWRCPKCLDEDGVQVYNSKWTTLRKSSRYYACEGECRRCRRKTRNILPHVVRTDGNRIEGKRFADLLSDEGWEEGAVAVTSTPALHPQTEEETNRACCSAAEQLQRLERSLSDAGEGCRKVDATMVKVSQSLQEIDYSGLSQLNEGIAGLEERIVKRLFILLTDFFELAQERPYCHSMNQHGEPCRAPPLKDSQYCMFHKKEGEA